MEDQLQESIGIQIGTESSQVMDEDEWDEEFCEDESSSSDEAGDRPVLAYDPTQLSGDLNKNRLPMNGHDYLKLVQEERAQCPAIVSVPLPKANIDKKPQSAKASDGEATSTKTPNSEESQLSSSLPTPLDIQQIEELKYKDEILSNFRTLREKIETIRESASVGKSSALVTTNNLVCDQEGKEQNEEQLKQQVEQSTKRAISLIKLMELGHPPQLSALIYKSQSDIHMTLERMADQCAHPHGIIHTDWVYSLMAALCEPIEPDICSTIRRLAKICISRRRMYERKAAKEAKHRHHLNEFVATSSPTSPIPTLQSKVSSSAATSKPLAEFAGSSGGSKGKGGNGRAAGSSSSKVENNEELVVRQLEEEEYNSCLLIICIVRHYFGQADLR